MKIKNIKKTNYALRLTVSAALCALSFVLMYLGTLTGVFDLCAVVIGAICTAFAVIELSGPWPWLIASVTSVLCLIMLPDKVCAMEYIVLGGFYPVLKAFFERLPKIFSWVVKLVFFNVLFTGCLALAKFVMQINEEWIAFDVIVYGLANIVFLALDLCLTVLISTYIHKLRHRFKFKF